MSNSYRSLASVRERNAALAAGRIPLPSIVPVPQYPDGAQPFTLDDWRAEQALRETVDNIAMSLRWRISIKLPRDKSVRVFYMCGGYRQTVTRARALFQTIEAFTCEPAGIGEFELADTRLSLLQRG